MKIPIYKNPWDDSEDLYKKSSIELKPGTVSILVGKNGSGKTTMIRMIKDYLKEKEIPYLDYNNMINGGHHAFEAVSYGLDIFKNVPEEDRTKTLVQKVMSSEGQNIIINLGHFISNIGKFFRECNSDKVFLLFDAIDSGLSIDNIEGIKCVFRLILGDNTDKEVYIVCSANSYSMVEDQICIDVTSCKEINFKDYKDYKKFILKEESKNGNS